MMGMIDMIDMTVIMGITVGIGHTYNEHET